MPSTTLGVDFFTIIPKQAWPMTHFRRQNSTHQGKRARSLKWYEAASTTMRAVWPTKRFSPLACYTERNNNTLVFPSPLPPSFYRLFLSQQLFRICQAEIIFTIIPIKLRTTPCSCCCIIIHCTNHSSEAQEESV